MLKPGSIVRIYCHFCKPPKIKFYVLVSVEPYAIGFLINSNPTPLQAIRQDLMDDLAIIKHTDHVNFLSYDSKVDCSEPIEHYELNDLSARVSANAQNNLGEITNDMAQLIKAKVTGSMNISPSLKKIILRNLEAVYPA